MITPCLWFEKDGLKAAEFYTSIFPDSKLIDPSDPKADLQFMVTFEIQGQRIMILNGGPHFTLSPAISLFVTCKDQAEVDLYWNKLLEGGEESRCGWLTDRYGVSWQIIPDVLGRLMSDPDKEKSQRVYDAMMGMSKIIVADLQAAYDGS